MSTHKLSTWIREESVIFANIPLKWHIAMLICGITVGLFISIVLKIAL